MRTTRHALRSTVAASLIVALMGPIQLARGDSTFTTTGFVPLPDLGEGLYQGHAGGLYPGGTSIRPAEHREAGLAAVGSIQPLDRFGNPDPVRGRIVLLSVGLSNTNTEFRGPLSDPAWQQEAFMTRALGLAARDPRVAIVNGAEGGASAQVWAAEGSAIWSMLTGSLLAAAVYDPQVQVVWMKLAEVMPADHGEFPLHAESLQQSLEQVARLLKARFPNLAVIYCSSRTRSWSRGIAGDGRYPHMNPEPYAYETGFAVRWMIEDQMSGREDLNFDPARGPVVAPWLTWGPYLWADGPNPRSDGLTSEFADVRSDDYTHPSISGTRKVADQLLAFFQTDETATWFLRAPAAPFEIDASADVLAGGEPLTVHFDAEAGAATYAWNFDDGTTSLARDPVKTFPVPGTYGVRMTASDAAGNSVTRALSIRVGGVTPTPRRVSAGMQHAVVVGPDGRVLAAGRNAHRQLGAPGADRPSFGTVPGVENVRSVVAGGFHSVALRSDGSLVAWGGNASGQLGIGTVSNAGGAAAVAWDAHDVSGVAAGWSHTLAWRSAGDLWAWGDNRQGQLGDGSSANRSLPVPIGLPGSVVQAAAGAMHSLAVLSDGTVWAWGLNGYGQLGDGTLVSSLAPVQVPGLPRIVEVAAGAYHSLALAADGTLWAWGWNLGGRLGDGTTANRSSPVLVSGVTGAIRVEAGMNFSAALLADGTVRAWGRNQAGQLGDGTSIDRSSPVLAAVSGIAELAAGNETLLLIGTDGTVLVQGSNASGQAGTGTAGGSFTPALANGLDLIP